MDHVVEALLAERAGDAVRVAGLAVERERLVGDRRRRAATPARARRRPRARAARRPAARERRARRATSTAASHSPSRGRVGDQHGAAAERGQRRGLERAVIQRPRRSERLLRAAPRPPRSAPARARAARPSTGAAARRALGSGGELRERLMQPAADLVRVRVPGQRARERDRDPQRVLGRAGAQQALERHPQVAALARQPGQPRAPVRARRLLRRALGVLEEVAARGGCSSAASRRRPARRRTRGPCRASPGAAARPRRPRRPPARSCS